MPDPARGAPGRELEELARTMRGALASLRAAAETLESLPELEGAPRARLIAVVGEESVRLGGLVHRLEEIARTGVDAGPSDAPAPATVAQLSAELARRARELGFEGVEEPTLGPELAALELALSGEEIVAAAVALLAALRREMTVARLRLGVRRVDRHLLLDLGWSPEPADLQRLLEWPGAALDAPAAEDARGGAGPGLRPLARDHDGEAWFIVERDGSAAHVKVLLPLAGTAAAPSPG